ncbi:MAG: hypothetical protein LBR10_14700 [Prevotellaceae bacterium]|jgi:hypothetical protein|nr:hypothetical protein [Prevotellaceae bacterium]
MKWMKMLRHKTWAMSVMMLHNAARGYVLYNVNKFLISMFAGDTVSQNDISVIIQHYSCFLKRWFAAFFVIP